MNKFKTKKGKCTRYALACGYLDAFDLDNDNYIRMSLEPNGFHLKGFKNGEHFWEIVEDGGIKEARKYFDRIVREMKGAKK